MNGETAIDQLIQGMQPTLNPGAYVFCSQPAAQLPADLKPICLFQEAEGTTVILPQTEADRLGWSYPFVAAWITLTVHSSLEAIGFTAAISQALTAAGISCNVVAAFYHDHLFVNAKDSDRAMQVLHELSQNSLTIAD